MRVLSVGPSSLTNQEVFAIVTQEKKELRARSDALLDQKPQDANDNIHEVQRQLESADYVTQYLERCYPAVARSDEAAVAKFLADISELPLEEEEVLQIINLAPCDPVFFYGLCQDCEERFSDEQVLLMCELVRKHLLRKPEPEAAAAPIADATDAKEGTSSTPETSTQQAKATSSVEDSKEAGAHQKDATADTSAKEISTDGASPSAGTRKKQQKQKRAQASTGNQDGTGKKKKRRKAFVADEEETKAAAEE